MARKTKEAQIQELKSQLEEYRRYVEKVDARNSELVNAKEDTFLHSPTYLEMRKIIDIEKSLRSMAENSLALAKKKESREIEVYRQIYEDNKLLMEKNGDADYFIGIAAEWRTRDTYIQMNSEIKQLKGKVEQLKESIKFRDDELQKLVKENSELQFRIDQLDSSECLGQSQTVHNIRGAGRKMMDEKMQEQLHSFSQMLSEGLSKEQIMDRLHISNATYYRYKKYLNSLKN